MSINRKIYILNTLIWLAVLAMALALVYEIGAWLLRHWGFP